MRFSQWRRGVGLLYYIIPTTGEVRYLGSIYKPYPSIDLVDGRIYQGSTDANGKPVIMRATYSGDFSAAPSQQSVVWAPFTSETFFSGSWRSDQDLQSGLRQRAVWLRHVGPRAVRPDRLRSGNSGYLWLARRSGHGQPATHRKLRHRSAEVSAPNCRRQDIRTPRDALVRAAQYSNHRWRAPDFRDLP
jgi:hypothetical protein